MTIKKYLRDVADKLLAFMYPALPVAIPVPVRSEIDRHLALFD